MNPGEFLLNPGEFLLNPGEFLLNPGEFLLNPGEFLLNPGEFLLNPGEFLFVRKNSPCNQIKFFNSKIPFIVQSVRSGEKHILIQELSDKTCLC